MLAPPLLRRILPASVPLRVAILAYLAHLLCEGWIGSSETFLGVAIVAAIVAMRRGELTIPFHPIYLPLALFVVASLLSAAASHRPWISLLNSREGFAFLTVPLALALYTRFRELPKAAIGCLAILAAFQSLYGLAQYLLLGYDTLERRITGTTAHVMTYSGILLPLSLMLLSLTLGRHRRWTWGACAFLTGVALTLTFTRGAWVGWVAGLIALALMRKPRVAFYLIPALILAITFSPMGIFGRLISSFDFRQTSVLDRIRMAEAGVEMIRDHPLLGVGPANIKEIYSLYRRADAPRFRPPHLHSNPIQIWAERGVLAIAAYVVLQAVFLLSAWRRRRDGAARPWAEGGIAAACALGIAGLFEFNFGDTEVVLTMLDVWALCLVASGDGVADQVEEGLAGEPAVAPA